MKASPCEHSSLFSRAQAGVYSRICWRRFVLESGEMKPPRHYLPWDLLPSCVGAAKSGSFCLWVQAEGRNLFRKDGWAP